MANEYYTHGGYPAQGASGSSAAMRAELDAIDDGFDKLPTLTGNNSLPVFVNSVGTSLEATSIVTAQTRLGIDTIVETKTHAATSKATPVDNDEMPLSDSAASWGLKKLTWANLKATLKTYFDTLYAATVTVPTGIVKGDGSAFSAATAGTDYAKPDTASSWTANQTFDSGTVRIKGSSTGVTDFASANASSNNYTITFPGASGTVAVSATAPITLSATGGISTSMATSRVLGRSAAGTGVAEELTLSQVLDLVGSAAQGDILYRDAAGWARLAAGTSGYYLKTQGAGANPTWAAVTATGKLVQRVEATPYTTYSSTGTAIPYDDTIPQNTEGAEIITVTITPTNASNRLRIVFDAPVCTMGAGGSAHAALFQGVTANALAACGRQVNTANALVGLHIEHEMAAGTTSATTFKVRAGPNTGTLYVNGSTSTRLFGGVSQVRLYVEEIA